MFDTLDVQAEQNLTFRLLVGYRWISLLPPLLWLTLPAETPAVSREWWAWVLAAGLTLLLTLGATSINRALLQRPWLLAFDLLLSAALVWYSGAERSSYYLYSLAPILAAAFFFRVRGGLLAAAVYTACYLPLVFVAPRSSDSTVSAPSAVGQVISFFLIGASFGYPAQLLQRLRSTHRKLADRNDELSRRNRDLDLMHELSLVMQSSVDPAELQEYVLHGLVHEMGYQRAVIGLFDEARDALTSWISLHTSDQDRAPDIAHTDMVRLAADEGPLARAIRIKQAVEVLDGGVPTGSRELNARLAVGSHYIVLPMSLRERPLGVILVDLLPAGRPLSRVERISLSRLAVHAGVALGSVRLCIDRAQREAVSEERVRIAADLHDSLSQTLYGLAYGMDACLQLLPHEPVEVQRALDTLYPMVTQAQAMMRNAIFDMWSDGIAADAFEERLRRHLDGLSPLEPPALRIQLPPDFDRWDATARGDLYRIAQEALANAAKHAAARKVFVTLTHRENQVKMQVHDDGLGFVPGAVDRSQHLGIQSMAERVERLGGTFDISGRPGAGTTITVQLPHTCVECSLVNA